ncbi:DNA cytosine methyltransferase [Bradyrhizobium elkanii]|uniref:DNA cytosine methyltransferase n=1 Tax=Bradyrhizobium elkanii TaxID=29448 RepID=UPI0014496D6A|nr:DNA (cytosine-5-)-methyltransferase [Bradyrhizobium elkanii]MCS3576549.1 DNA (cytosine-5)-methyltransferase 1 [Bradyrhizobium elkanii]MCS3719438.1 DNA (cytosine-5)-methyltransferase 1 [Bradyrhizobium elkanii]MCS4003843.1 DNA (cytosine-5)-methyltransferase 1 [Bradyrhizobium elkanii USDA 61]BBB99006.1 methylase [Bradyrhizobium elkanii USDA 61]
MTRTLDIFSGGGGSSYGARNAGAQIVCGIDLCEVATATYKDNFPKATSITKALEIINPRKLHDSIGDIDLLLASPECTNHTCAKGSAPRSEESRATAMQALRFAREFKPRWLILENVVHMRPWSRYDELKEALENLGYHVTEFVLDASDFGVAQSRRRLFVVCDLEGPVTAIKRPRRKRKNVSDILDPLGTWGTTGLFRPNRAKPTLERAERAFAEMGKRASFLLVYYGTDGGGGWQRLDRPLRTITTVDRFALVEPGDDGHQMRMLQVPELKRAMGFKTDYTMNHGTRRENIKILGNGVCPPVMEAIVETITSG